MEEKKKSNKGLVVALVFFIITTIGFGCFAGYLYLNKDDVKETTTVKNYKAEKEEETTKVISSVGFDGSKCINNKNYAYSVSRNESVLGLSMSIAKDQKSVNLSVDLARINSNYGFGWVTAADFGHYETRSVSNFDKKVVDVYIGGFGQAIGQETLLYLMEDGTVEYTKVKDAMQADNNTIKSSGKIDGVEGVVRFESVSVTAGTSGAATTVAIKEDGTFYDLSSLLFN